MIIYNNLATELKIVRTFAYRLVGFIIMKDTKDIILKTAYNLFLYNNYEAVTIHKIIQATGLTKGAIYYYYASKEEIFKAVIDKYMLENRADPSEEFDTLQELVQHSIESLKSKITRMAIENSSDGNVPIDYLSLFVAAFRYYPGFANTGSQFFNAVKERWVKAIKKAIKNNEIRNDIDVEAMANNFLQISSSIVGSMIMGGNVLCALDMIERQFREIYRYIRK